MCKGFTHGLIGRNSSKVRWQQRQLFLKNLKTGGGDQSFQRVSSFPYCHPRVCHALGSCSEEWRNEPWRRAPIPLPEWLISSPTTNLSSRQTCPWLVSLLNLYPFASLSSCSCSLSNGLAIFSRGFSTGQRRQGPDVTKLRSKYHHTSVFRWEHKKSYETHGH